MGRAIDEIVGQRAALRIAPAIRQFGLQDAGGAGAEENADAGRAVTCYRRPDPVGEAVGFEPEPGQAVVAAIVAPQEIGQFFGVDRGNLADPRIQFHCLEGARCEAARPARSPSSSAAQPWPRQVVAV